MSSLPAVVLRSISFSSASLLAARIPSIKFPIRRSPDGQILSLLSLSLDNLTSSSTSTDTTPNKRYDLELPVNYGRVPLSNTEIDIINSGGVIE